MTRVRAAVHGSRRVAKPLRTVGRSLARIDGDAKARGVALFPQDRPWPTGTLHAATVRAAVACARVRAVDVAPALATRGVVRVLTAADVRGSNRFGLLEADQPVLVTDRIRGASDVVALVLATSERAARAGARRVRLALDVAHPLVDPERACDPDAPILHPERTAVGAHPNLVAHATIRRGAVARALARAAVVVESEYTTGFVEHAFLGPEAGLVEPEPDPPHTARRDPVAGSGSPPGRGCARRADRAAADRAERDRRCVRGARGRVVATALAAGGARYRPSRSHGVGPGRVDARPWQAPSVSHPPHPRG